MSMNLIKRIVPFVLAIALGMFIASFFVTVGFPKFREGQRFSHRHKRGEEMRRIQVERDALQREREALEREKELMRLNVEGELRNARIQNYGSDETVPRGQGHETGNGRSRR